MTTFDAGREPVVTLGSSAPLCVPSDERCRVDRPAVMNRRRICSPPAAGLMIGDRRQPSATATIRRPAAVSCPHREAFIVRLTIAENLRAQFLGARTSSRAWSTTAADSDQSSLDGCTTFSTMIVFIVSDEDSPPRSALNAACHTARYSCRRYRPPRRCLTAGQ